MTHIGFLVQVFITFTTLENLHSSFYYFERYSMQLKQMIIG